MVKIVETKHIFPCALDIHQELIIIFIVSFIEDLCNGSTPDSDSVCGGSNPSSSAKNNGYPLGYPLFFASEGFEPI